MDLFETKCVISENSMRELKRYFIAPRAKIISVLGIIISIYAAIIFESPLFFLLAILFILMIPYDINQNIKIIIKRMQESTNAQEYETTTSFGEDSLKCINHSTNGTVTFSYDSIERFVETKNHYALFTGANQYILVNKNDIEQTHKTEEFIGFVKSHCKNLKVKSKILPIVLICLACVIAAFMYWEDGRTIFENRSELSASEKQTINEILAFEQQKLSECQELLLPYGDRAKELGIEIRPILERTRAVNHQGRVEKHDLQNEMWLPKYYSSQIICYAYKDGEKLEKHTSYNSWSYFADIFWLVNERKDDNAVEYNENPFYGSYIDFDTSIERLLKQVSDYLNG